MRIDEILENFRKNRYDAYYLEKKEEVVPLLKKLLAKGCSVSVGGSETLKQVGAIDLLKSGEYAYLDRYQEGLSPEQVRQIFLDALSADAYLTSANAITEQGELVNVDGNCNRIAAISFGPESVIVVVGINKIVPNVEAGIRRIKTIAAPRNTKRLGCNTYCNAKGVCKGVDGEMTDGCGSEGRICCGYLISGPQRRPGRVKLILVGEELGY